MSTSPSIESILTDSEVLSILLVIVAIIAVIALLGWNHSRQRPAKASKRRNHVARKAETAAEEFLQTRGYDILERQIEQPWTLLVDGVPRQVKCRADLLVERQHRLFIVDVKSGVAAPDPALPSTRRQLLEYLLAFAEVDGVLLVDMSQRQIYEVDFSKLLQRV